MATNSKPPVDTFQDVIPSEPRPVGPGLHRIEQLDSLRGLAALIVFLSHSFVLREESSPIKWWLGKLPTRFFLDGHPAVLFFFVLSGFVLYLPFSKPITPRYKPYIVRRICRIYLPYLAGIAFTAIACQIFGHEVEGLGPLFAWHRLTGMEFLKESLLHISFILPINRHMWNKSIWTLCEEMRISFFFPVLALVVRRYSWRKALVVALCLLVTGNFLVELTQHGIPFISMHYAAIFMVGAMMAKYRASIGSWFQPKKIRIPAMIFAVLTIMYSSSLVESSACFNHWAGTYKVALADTIVTLGNCVLLMAALLPGAYRNFLLWKPVQGLGRISYSFYLYHFPALALAGVLLFNRIPDLAVIGAALVATVMLATASYRWIELPSIALGRRLTHVPPVAVTR